MGIKEIESLLDLNNNKIRQLYNSWDKGDCSKIGLTKILLYQNILEYIDNNGVYYDGEYDDLLEKLNYEK